MTTTVPQNNTRSIILTAIRVFVGLLFIFSGLIKANDPNGLAYKMTEFFEVWNMPGMGKFSLIFSLIMISFEILAGVAMIIGYAYRAVSILILLLTIFFTFLTGYAVLSGKIKECGCFGDCIPLEAYQSFIKDIILLVLVFILYLNRKHIRPLFKNNLGTGIMLAALALTGYAQYYTLAHLPVVDCLAYKKGNNIWKEMQIPEGAIPDKFESILVYEKNGKRIEYTEAQFSADSTLWDNPEMKFIESKTKLVQKGNAEPKILDFAIRDFNGEDYTEALLKEPGYTYLIFLKDASLFKGDASILKKLNEEANQKGIGFYILTANDEAQTNKFKVQYGLDADAYTIDGTVCKTAMRSNGGLMLIKGGTVINKWSRNDYPTTTVNPED